MRSFPVLWIAVLAVLAVLGLLAGPATASEPRDQGVWPLQPRPPVVNGFEPPASAYGPGHRGVDLGGSTAQAVRATLAGTVSFAGTLAGRGVVVVDHGGFRTTYEPVAASVRTGQTVNAGEVVGTLRTGGSHCFPRTCLHWGLYVGRRTTDSYRNPLVLVGAGPIRLLPPGAHDLLGPGPGPFGQARGWASRYAARSRSLETWV